MSVHQPMSITIHNTFLEELPFHPSDDDITSTPEISKDPKELLLDGYQNTKYPADGFLDFFAIKICSSNAKKMASFLELSMGFEEVAYKGLETKSKKIASHVVKNGNIFFEIVNTLEMVEENYENYPMNELPNFTYNEFDRNDLFNEFINKLKIYIFSIAERYTSKLTNDDHNQTMAMRNFRNSLINTSQYKDIVQQYKKSINNLTDITENLLYDIFDSYLIQNFITKHGEGVNDILIKVTDVDEIFKKAIDSGAKIIKPLKVYRDSYGSVKSATISVPFTDIRHTLIENIDYNGPYLPGYEKPESKDGEYLKSLKNLPPVDLNIIDHCVQNYTWNEMMTQAEFYAKIFGLHKFWSVDEQDVSTGETALRSIVMASSNGKIKIPINEPAKGLKRGQIEEFYDYNGGPGVQHIALKTYDIIKAVKSLKARGIEFNTISDSYYEVLTKRLRKDKIVLFENFKEIKELGILVDFDAMTKYEYKKSKFRCNYILQIFTKPLHDRPTLFIEIIQRHHHSGFGKGTFKGLFETIEAQQKIRGTLTAVDGNSDEFDDDKDLLI